MENIGKWEVVSTDDKVMIRCPECGRLVCTESPDSYYYCPQCGERMIGGEVDG